METHRVLKVAVVQMAAGKPLEAGLQRMERFVEEAKAQGAELVAFPELAYLAGSVAEFVPSIDLYSNIVKRFSEMAKRNAISILPGSLREPVPQCPGRFFNTLPYLDAEGKVVAAYRKIFLFKADLPDKKYDEGEHCNAGDEVTCVRDIWGVAGLSICYDLRFPELFRALRAQGAQVLFIPSAFTVPTGKVHWRPLLTARAIENQCFVVAPGQCGANSEGTAKYGHSLVISPWGETLLDMEQAEGVRTVELPLSQIGDAAKRVDVWGSRRNDLFPWKG